jgi:citrate synthase
VPITAPYIDVINVDRTSAPVDPGDDRRSMQEVPRAMATTADVRDGLEGVLAFASEIAEPDRDGGALRYRGVDVEELVGALSFEGVWGLLVDGRPDRPLQAVDQAPAIRTGDPRVDLQATLATLAPAWALEPLVDTVPATAREQLARASSATLSIVAASARGADLPSVPSEEIAAGRTLAEQFLLRWRGEADPEAARALDAYWITAAEHGMNASTFTARVIASTGADVAAALSGAVGALSGPLHGGAPARVLAMLEAVQRDGDADRWIDAALGRGERIMGFGHRVYRAEDPRARALRRIAVELGSERVQVALEVERAALDALAAHRPGRVLATNVEFWAAVVLDFAGVPQHLFTTLFASARTAGWSAHVLEQRCRGRLIRPASLYVGCGPRGLAEVGSAL